MNKFNNIKEIESFMNENRFCCLNPTPWWDLWKMIERKIEIKGKKITEVGPLILGAWHHASKDEKYKRFISHMLLAKDTEQFTNVLDFLNKLNIDDWSDY